jgi:hypothetical protein
VQRTLAALTGIDRRERRPINGEGLLRFWETVIGGNNHDPPISQSQK